MNIRNRATLLAAVLATAALSSRVDAASRCEAARKPTVDRCLKAHPIKDGSNDYRICVECETECLHACERGRSIAHIDACSTSGR